MPKKKIKIKVMNKMQIRITYPPMKRRKVLVRSYCAHRVTK